MRLLPLPQDCGAQDSACLRDRDPDHKPRTSCEGLGLSALPAGLNHSDQVLVLARNQIDTLDWTWYTVFQALFELDLSHNRVSTLRGWGKPGKPGMGDGGGPRGAVLVTLRKLHLKDN
ncbi:uncharacterized protein gp1ba [Amia ocellicauda]|uniref:uncharacterized protein gp1ba n=1 Tax=Amia ocellicauda TaxID=2972642 RepID=UPI0034648A28